MPSKGNRKTIYKSLDISKAASVKALVSDIKSAGSPVDVLINNAGVNLDDDFNYENAKTTLDVNYRGTLAVCRAFLPLLAKDGRIVSLSSVGSSLDPFSKQNATRFRTVSSLDELESFMHEYEDAVKQGKDEAAGFPKQHAYSVSKACINAFTGILAKQNDGLTINCCCPGWVDTDMGGMMGKPPKTPQDGAKIPVRLAFGDIDGVTGRYWANDSIRSKEEGKVQQW